MLKETSIIYVYIEIYLLNNQFDMLTQESQYQKNLMYPLTFPYSVLYTYENNKE